MEIFEFRKNELPQICSREDIVFMGIFGSYAKGKETETSDVDLLVRFSKKKSLLDLVRIERELSEILNKKVDLLTEPAISPYLQGRIKAELKVLYER